MKVEIKRQELKQKIATARDRTKKYTHTQTHFPS